MSFKFLSPEQIRYYCERILMPPEATSLLMHITESIHSNPQLFAIYTDFYKHFIQNGYWTTIWEQLSIDPYVESQFGQHASLFYLHATLELLPITEQRYQERGISDAIFVETLRDISTWVQNAYRLVGYYAIRNIHWIWRHLEAKLFRIGRLQYMPIQLNEDLHVFRNIHTGETLILAESGLAIRANGDMQGVCGKPHTSDGFITTFEESSTHYIGYPITPYGKCASSITTLTKIDWQPILQKGDYILEIHIPRDGDFTPDALRASYLSAQKFFTLHFPEYSLKGMYCHTWLFTPQLQDILPASSNIVAFQRNFYLYPHAGSKNFAWNFVFNELQKPEEVTADTYLRQQLLDYVLQDKEIFDLKGLYLNVSGEFTHFSYMDYFDQRNK